jgi:hypothetical protein
MTPSKLDVTQLIKHPIPKIGEVEIIRENFTPELIKDDIWIAQYYQEFRLFISLQLAVTISSEDALWIIGHKILVPSPSPIIRTTIIWKAD